MAKPRKGKIKVRQKVGLRKKGEAPAGKTRVAGRPPANNATTLKIKMHKK